MVGRVCEAMTNGRANFQFLSKMPEIDPQLMNVARVAERTRARRGVLVRFVLLSFLMMPVGYVIA